MGYKYFAHVPGGRLWHENLSFEEGKGGRRAAGMILEAASL